MPAPNLPKINLGQIWGARGRALLKDFVLGRDLKL